MRRWVLRHHLRFDWLSARRTVQSHCAPLHDYDALTQFRKASGWTAGVDATVAVADIGANGSIDTNTLKQPVVGFVLSNAGLMAGVSL